MKIFSSYTLRPGCTAEAAKRFLAGQATPPAGLKLIGRWHKTDGTGGYSVFEAENLATVYEFSVSWTDVLEIHDHVVVEDAEIGPALARVFGK
jgi:hypothetical protein